MKQNHSGDLIQFAAFKHLRTERKITPNSKKLSGYTNKQAPTFAKIASKQQDGVNFSPIEFSPHRQEYR